MSMTFGDGHRQNFDGAVLERLMRHVSSEPRTASQIASAAGIAPQRASRMLTIAAQMGAVRTEYRRTAHAGPPITLYSLKDKE